MGRRSAVRAAPLAMLALLAAAAACTSLAGLEDHDPAEGVADVAAGDAPTGDDGPSPSSDAAESGADAGATDDADDGAIDAGPLPDVGALDVVTDAASDAPSSDWDGGPGSCDPRGALSPGVPVLLNGAFLNAPYASLAMGQTYLYFSDGKQAWFAKPSVSPADGVHYGVQTNVKLSDSTGATTPAAGVWISEDDSKLTYVGANAATIHVATGALEQFTYAYTIGPPSGSTSTVGEPSATSTLVAFIENTAPPRIVTAANTSGAAAVDFTGGRAGATYPILAGTSGEFLYFDAPIDGGVKAYLAHNPPRAADPIPFESGLSDLGHVTWVSADLCTVYYVSMSGTVSRSTRKSK